MSAGGESNARRAAGEHARERPGFRPDIEGLRAVALLVMLLYHAQLSFAHGGFVGIDVFFVISGFLITRLLVDEAERSGTIALGRFYAYRIKRLLPMVDYFAGGYAASPVQHFWTLSIEEQFYIVWPLLLLGFTWWWRRRGGSVRPGAWIAVATVGLTSLAYGIWYSFESPNEAYFSTFTRSWDMALGGALALATIPRLGVKLAGVLGLVGLAAIAIGTFALDELTPYPGVAALLPSLGAGLLIVAGSANARAAVSSRVLSLRLACISED